MLAIVNQQIYLQLDSEPSETNGKERREGKGEERREGKGGGGLKN